MSLNYLEIAKAFAKEQGDDIVLPAGIEGKWHYFAHTRKGLPRYGSLPGAIRINPKGEIEILEGYLMRRKVSLVAYDLMDSKNLLD